MNKNQECWQKDLVLSPCMMAASGIAGLLRQNHRYVFDLLNENVELCRLPDSSEIRLITVFIPEHPYWLLSTIRQIAHLFNQLKFPVPMLILSHCSSPVLWQTLKRLVHMSRWLDDVRVGSAGLSCNALTRVLLHGYCRSPRLKLQAQYEDTSCGFASTGLTERELIAVMDYYSGYRVQDLAKRHNISTKTLYGQRTSGLKKLADHLPWLVSRCPEEFRKKQPGNGNVFLTVFEQEIIHATENHNMYPLFQPIVNCSKLLWGVNLSLCWLRNGREWRGDTFFSGIHSRYVRLLLTAFLLQEAVNHINQYDGEFYFSVHLPYGLMEDDGTFQMIKTACRKLHKIKWVPKLCLIISNMAGQINPKSMMNNIYRLQQTGVNIIFSDGFESQLFLRKWGAPVMRNYELQRYIKNPGPTVSPDNQTVLPPVTDMNHHSDQRPKGVQRRKKYNDM